MLLQLHWGIQLVKLQESVKHITKSEKKVKICILADGHKHNNNMQEHSACSAAFKPLKKLDFKQEL